MELILLTFSHLFVIYLASKFTAKAIYTDIKANYDVFESVRIIEPKSDIRLDN